MKKLRAFGAFWYDFVIGDDWRVALGVVLALALTFVVGQAAAVPTWWILPVTVAVLLPVSLWREVRKTRGGNE